MKHLTVRNVPDDLARALERERRQRGTSLNQLVIDLLRQATGAGQGVLPDNGLGRLAGTWSDSDVAEFQQATKRFDEVDAEMWT